MIIRDGTPKEDVHSGFLLLSETAVPVGVMTTIGLQRRPRVSCVHRIVTRNHDHLVNVESNQFPGNE